MQAGKLDRQVVLKHRSLGSPDANGERAASFATYATVRAQKIDIVGREYFASRQVQSEVSTRFRIRYRSDVLVTDTLEEGGVTYNVHSVAEIGRKEATEILASVVS